MTHKLCNKPSCDRGCFTISISLIHDLTSTPYDLVATLRKLVTTLKSWYPLLKNGYTFLMSRYQHELVLNIRGLVATLKSAQSQELVQPIILLQLKLLQASHLLWKNGP